MKNIFAAVIVFAIIFNVSTSLASEKLIEASGEYIMDTRLDETFASATARAREEAKRAVAEKAGVYVQSYSKTIDLVLDTDEIQTVAARLLKIQEESSITQPAGANLLKFTVTIKALVDDLDENTLKSMMQNRQALEDLTRKNKELQEKYDALNRQMEKYRADFDSASNAQKIEIKKEVTRNTERFSAVDELAKGNDFSFRKDYSQALSAYDNAIRLDLQLAEAYNNRGIIKYELGQFLAAIEDYNIAIRLKSNYADALNNRGNAYAALGQFQNAENDLQSAVRLNSNSATIHNNLGSVYLSQKNFNAAIEEYSRAIQLNPNFAEAYYNRAVTYYAQRNLDKATIDAQKAFSLKPNDVEIRAFYDKVLR